MTVVFAFLACLALFVVIGVLSLRRAKGTTEDYLLAGRDVSPWLMGLSSAATNNSGFMFIGLFGFTYRFGVQAVWLQLGWILGDVIAWQWIHRRVRERSGAIGATSVPTLLATDTDGRSSRSISVVAGLLTFLFLGGYAAGQLVAGATTLDGMFGWSPSVGVLIGAAIVVVYCFSGGLRASIWTGAALLVTRARGRASRARAVPWAERVAGMVGVVRVRACSRVARRTTARWGRRAWVLAEARFSVHRAALAAARSSCRCRAR